MLQYPYPIRITPIWGKTMRQFSERFSSCRTQQEYTQVGIRIFRLIPRDFTGSWQAILEPQESSLSRFLTLSFEDFAEKFFTYTKHGFPFDHKRNETSWHPMKQNDIIHLKFNDTESRQYRIVHCVFERSTMGFKRPWVRFSPLGPNKNNPNLFPIGDGFGLFVF